MSSINPNNIDGTYPIAGQDNDSQGFRDNFTNIKNNFTFAYDELTDLQSKAVLKSALNGVSLSNDMAYAQLISAQLLKTVETVNPLGTKTGSFTISWADGHFQYYTTSGNTTLAFSNWPTSNYHTKLRLQITTDTTNRTVTFPSAVSVGLSDVQGASGQVVTFPTAGVYLFELTTVDNGTTITIQDLLRNYTLTNTAVTGSFTNVNATGNVLAQIGIYNNLTVNGNVAVGKTGAVSGSWTTVVGNITQTTSGGAVYINTAGNVIAANASLGALTVNGGLGFINTSGNVSAAVYTGGAVTVTGLINTTGNISAAVVNGGTINSTGLINTTGNVSAAVYSGGAVTVTGAITTSGTSAIGYATGAGGTITQGSGSEKNTTVVLNKTTGTITLNGGICFANARVANSFTLTNSTIGNQDLIVIQHVNTGALGGYIFAANTATAGGSAQISVRNHTELDLSEAIVIRFAVIKSTDA